MTVGLPDRAAARAALTEWRRPVWIEAGAGTGKTTVLVARIAAWTLGPGWERHAERVGDDDAERVAAAVLAGVVAITFTEAAAAEMAIRVGAVLRDVAEGRPVPVLDEGPPRPEEAPRRARALLACLDQFPVQTIHAFCRRVLASHAVDAGLHPRFQVDADERVLHAVSRDVTEGALQEAYGQPGSSDALALATDGIGPPELEEALRTLLQAGVPAGHLQRDPLSPEESSAFATRLASALDAFVAAEAGVLTGNARRTAVQRTAQSLVRTRELLRGREAPELEVLARDVDALWPDANDRKRLASWARDRFNAEGEDLADAREAVVEACAIIAPHLRFLFELDPPRLRRTRRVLAPLVEEAEAELRRRGAITYGGLLRETRDLLSRCEPVRQELRRGIDQLLVDEFQDTDGIQCEIVRRLALSEGGEGPGLFLVGDPKQSIYGWRNADLRAYHAFTRELDAAGGLAGELVVNRRSTAPILREVERAVAPVMQAEPGVQPSFRTLACGREEAPPLALQEARAVEHWVSWPWSEEDDAPADRSRALEATRLEARSVARNVRRLHDEEGVAWRDFGLLFRSTGQLDLYLSELRDAGVPYVVERDHTFYERREVIDAIALVRAVLDRHDQVGLVAALRSAVVGVPDAALLPLWQEQLPAHLARLPARDPSVRAAAREAVRAAAAALPDGVEGLERLAGWEAGLLAFLDAVAELRTAFRRESPDRFVERLRTTLPLEAVEAPRTLGPWRLANLDRFFRDLAVALEESGGDVAAVLGALRGAVSDRREDEEGRPRDAVDDAVHVGTIHKAKGLAFEHVYLCQVHKGRGGARGAGHAVVHRGDRVALRLFGQSDPGLPGLAAESERVEQAEQVRTLYVALTRARERLVVAGQRAGRRNGSHAQLLGRSEPDAEELAQWMREARRVGGWSRDDVERGIRWVFPALRKEEPMTPPDTRGTGAPDAAGRLEEDRERLTRRRADAEALARRPFHRTASEEGHDALAEWRTRDVEGEAGEEDVSGGPVSRDEAMQAGHAVHAALELTDPGGSREELARSLGRALEAALPEDAAKAARRRAMDILARFLDGPLAERLRALAPHVVARELPVLLPPGDGPEEPVGFWSGAIDLLYRDPESGALVVADYKTDAVEGDALRARAAAYAGQGRVYTRAVQDALGLAEPPRFELWFLQAGEVVRA